MLTSTLLCYVLLCRNNENLGRLADKIVSPLIFAHVRAAYPGMPVSDQNCHPFQWGRYMFMHNGVVGGFMKIRRSLIGSLSDAAYDTVQSFQSDSAVCFALFLHHLPNLTSLHPPYVLLRAIEVRFGKVSTYCSPGCRWCGSSCWCRFHYELVILRTF